MREKLTRHDKISAYIEMTILSNFRRIRCLNPDWLCKTLHLLQSLLRGRLSVKARYPQKVVMLPWPRMDGSLPLKESVTLATVSFSKWSQEPWYFLSRNSLLDTFKEMTISNRPGVDMLIK